METRLPLSSIFPRINPAAEGDKIYIEIKPSSNYSNVRQTALDTQFHAILNTFNDTISSLRFHFVAVLEVGCEKRIAKQGLNTPSFKVIAEKNIRMKAKQKVFREKIRNFYKQLKRCTNK